MKTAQNIIPTVADNINWESTTPKTLHGGHCINNNDNNNSSSSKEIADEDFY